MTLMVFHEAVLYNVTHFSTPKEKVDKVQKSTLRESDKLFCSYKLFAFRQKNVCE